MTNRRQIRPVLLLAAVSAASAAAGVFLVPALWPDADSPMFEDGSSAAIVLGGERFSAIIAASKPSRMLGLGGREGLGNTEAMLLVFPKDDYYGIWMKDMLFPIDIIWLDGNFDIISLKERVSPDTYPAALHPDSKALYVVEVASGVIDRLGLLEGQRVFIFPQSY